MNRALDVFRANLQRVRSIHGLHGSFSSRVTAAIDLSDILRAEIVLIISALDYFVHELTRTGMMEVWSGKRTPTPSYSKFPISMKVAKELAGGTGFAFQIESEIRERHGIVSFQKPDSIADAIRLFSAISLWNRVATEIGEDAKMLQAQLKLIVDRRNKIAHEADIDPSYPGQRWPITPYDVEEALKLVERIGEAIFRLVT
jgi:hypothetical protein